VPGATGNFSNEGQFVTDPNGDTWYIDMTGRAITLREQVATIDTIYITGDSLYILLTDSTLYGGFYAIGPQGEQGVTIDSVYVTGDSLYMVTSDSIIYGGFYVTGPQGDPGNGIIGSGDNGWLAVWLNDTLTEAFIYQGPDSTLELYYRGFDNPFTVFDGANQIVKFDLNADSVIDIALTDTMLIAEKVRVGNHTAVTTQALAGFDSLNVMSRVILGNALSISPGASYDTLQVVPEETNYGSGTTNYVSKWSAADTLSDSQIFDNGTSIGIGVASPLSGRLHVRAAGSGSANMLTMEQQDGDDVLTLLENSSLLFGSGDKPRIFPMSTTNITTPATTGSGLAFATAFAATTGPTSFYFHNSSSIAPVSSGTGRLLKAEYTFAPSLGSEKYNGFEIVPTINQTGAASGATRGIVINPTLTSAISWASYESRNTSGIAFYETGGADSRFVGNVKVGADSAPLRDIDVTGTLRVSAQVDSAELERVWMGNAEGDLRRVKLGANLSISNDTLNAASSGGTEAYWDGGTTHSSFVYIELPNSTADTVAFEQFGGGAMQIVEWLASNITFDTIPGSSYVGWTFEDDGVYAVSYQFNGKGTNAGSTYYMQFRWHVNWEYMDADQHGFRTHWNHSGTNYSTECAVFYVNATAGDYLQLVARYNNGAGTDYEMNNFRLQIKKVGS
jgi:hypothetical protein